MKYVKPPLSFEDQVKHLLELGVQGDPKRCVSKRHTPTPSPENGIFTAVAQGCGKGARGPTRPPSDHR